MTHKEKAAGVLEAPEAAEQKTGRAIIGGMVVPVNGARALSMLDAMRSVALGPFKDIDLVPDGKLRRYRVEGDKAGSANGWFVLHSHPILAGAFGSWKTGESHNWREVRDRPPTRQEREQLRQAMQAAQSARVVEQAAVHEQARQKADRLWQRGQCLRGRMRIVQTRQWPACWVVAVVPQGGHHGL